MILESLFFQLGLFLISLLSNFFSALAGGGAGLLQLPALILIGLPFQVALATHKVASVALGLGATIRHLREGSLRFGYCLYILICGLPGVYLGARFVLDVPERVLTLLLGLLTLSLAIYSLSNKQLGVSNTQINLDLKQFFIGGVVLFFIGFMNGSMSSGTGLFVTIWLVRWFGMDYGRAVAYTLILVGLFWNGTGAFVLGMQGQIAWEWLLVLFLGSLGGGYLGAHVAISQGNRLVKRAFELLTLLMGSSMVFKSL